MILNKIYNAQSVAEHRVRVAQFADSKAGIMLGKNLVSYDLTIYERKYPANVFLNAGFKIDNTGGVANSIEKLRTTTVGSFVEASQRGTNKGKLTLSAEDDRIPSISKVMTIEYTAKEVRQAQMQNFNLIEKLLSSTDEIYKREIDEAIALGVKNGKGLLNTDDFARDVQTSSAISGLSGVDLYEMFSQFIIKQFGDVNNTPEYMGNLMILPTNVYNVLLSKVWKESTTEKKVLQILKEAYPDINFVQSFRAQDVDKKTIVSFVSTNENAMQIRIPEPLIYSPTTQDASVYKTDAQYSIAGIDILEGKAGRTMEVKLK